VEELVKVKFLLFRFFSTLKDDEYIESIEILNYFFKNSKYKCFQKGDLLNFGFPEISPKLSYCFKFKNFPKNIKNSDLINLCHVFIHYNLNRDFSLIRLS
jgi:hypothetical protein